jgi:leucyl-tRNA synthetase
VRVACPRCGGPAERETDVSDTFLDSSWYFLRYPSTGRDAADRPWDPDRTARWLPVDLYAGGPEHVTRHHLYSRFVTMALHDRGLVPIAEPFPRVRLHGVLTMDGAKMSKSRGNVVNPDRMITEHGADATRLSLLFARPWSADGPWIPSVTAGVERFLARVWRLAAAPPGADGTGTDALPKAIDQVTHGIEHMRFNTAIAALMSLVGELRGSGLAPGPTVQRTLVGLLAPLAPHVAEELWHRIGGHGSVHHQPWPGSGRVE